MTTIAFDGNVLAADGKMVDGDAVISLNTPKLFTTVIGGTRYAVGFTGWCTDPEALYAWAVRCVYTGERTNRPMGDWVLLLVEYNEHVNDYPRVYRAFNDNKSGDFCFPRELDAKLAAIGSGWHFAMGAMHAGEISREAVHIASNLDNCTGGAITYIDMLTGQCDNVPEILVRTKEKDLD